MNNQQYLDNCETMNFQNGNIKATAKMPKLLADFTNDINPCLYVSPEHIFLATLTTYAYSQQNNFIIDYCDNSTEKSEFNLNLFSMCFIPSGMGITSTLCIFKDALLPNFDIDFYDAELINARELLQKIKKKNVDIEKKKQYLKELQEIVTKRVKYMYFISYLQKMESVEGAAVAWCRRFINNTAIFYDGDYYKYKGRSRVFNQLYNGETNSITSILNITAKIEDNSILKKMENLSCYAGKILMCDYNKNLNCNRKVPFVDKQNSTPFKILKDTIAKNLEPKIINVKKYLIDTENVEPDFYGCIDPCLLNYFLSRNKKDFKAHAVFTREKTSLKKLKFSEEAKQFIYNKINGEHLYDCFKKWYVFLKKSYGPNHTLYNNLKTNSLKISALFHLAAGFDENTEISKECVENAFEVAKFYIENSFKVISNYKE